MADEERDPVQGSGEEHELPVAPDAEEGTPPDTGGQPLVLEQGRDQRVPSWLDTTVQYTWRGLVLIVGLTAALFVMTRLYLVTLPIIIALILSTLFVPPARRLERHGLPRAAAASIVVIGGIGVLAGLIALLTPPFIDEIQKLRPTVLDGIDRVLTWAEEGPIGWDRTQIEQLFTDAMEQFEGVVGTIAAQIGSIAVAVVEGITAMILATVLLFFFVKDGAQLVDWFITRTPPRHRDTIRAAGKRAWTALSGFVRGTALVALVDAVGIGIGLWIVGVPLILPLAVLVFLGGFVPVIGAFITGLLAVLVALAAGGLTTALIVLAIVVAVQQIESNILQPTIMRRAVSLHPVVILGVLTAGAVLIGIVGAFLAVPVAAVLAAVGNEMRLRQEAQRHGIEPGARPLGGPDVDPELLLPEFPEDTDLRAVRKRRRERVEGQPVKVRRRHRNRRRGRRGDDQDDAGSEPTAEAAGDEGGTPDEGTAGTEPAPDAGRDPDRPHDTQAAAPADRGDPAASDASAERT
jgi:putative heme transporter